MLARWLDEFMVEVGRSFLIVGVVRNCASVVEQSVSTLEECFSQFGSVEFVLIESDSSDQTLGVLSELRRSKKNFHFQSMGDLRAVLPGRTERIAYCRNEYLREVARRGWGGSDDYVVVADFDGVNAGLTASAVGSCFESGGWDVVTANQDAPYYDVWALRHRDWCPGDCWREFNFLVRHGLAPNVALVSAILSRQLHLRPDTPWVEVDSAFGGLAIYRRSCLTGATYAGVDRQGEEVCEHVVLHGALRALGYKICLNPKLINGGYNEHTEKYRSFFQSSMNL